MLTTPATARGQWRIRLFGPEAAACGKSEVLLPGAPSTLRVADLRALLAQSEPSLSPFLQSARFAVNCAFVDDSAVVRPEDEIAVIGMVFGG
jgi:molybdopterin converting factor small subunit